MTNEILIAINIFSGCLLTIGIFILKDIKEDIKISTAEFLKHVANYDIHCSKDKFKVHITNGAS